MTTADIRNNKDFTELIEYFLLIRKSNISDDRLKEIIKAFEEIGIKVSTFFDLDKCKADINISITEIQSRLSKLNERTVDRRKRGAYYTPEDVTNYIVINTFINYLFPDNNRMYNFTEGTNKLLTQPEELLDLIFNKVIYDPTCGAAEFLMSAVKIKIELLKKVQNNINTNDLLTIIRTIKGNDINNDSTVISIIRLFIEIETKLENDYIVDLVTILKHNFTEKDFVMINHRAITRSDIVVGNPPYVEYRALEERPAKNYGNIYADIFENSVRSLRRNGVYGLVIPLSYVSTTRMQRIRNYIEENTRKQIILSFADRPDCLFNGVHQKLCIVIGIKSRAQNVIMTSNYRHWYKSERHKLLNGCSIFTNDFRHEGFIPKIGNAIEQSIFRKVFTNTEENLLAQLEQGAGEEQIFVNMRATFYIKAFSHNPGSNEYKGYRIDNEKIGFVLCLLNSSLYFLFWTIISDCWHITKKELRHFRLPEINIDYAHFNKLSRELEIMLEETKKYIGSVQTEYEYKHKECFDILNRIDEELGQVFELTKTEVKYIKGFAHKYRVGNDNG